MCCLQSIKKFIRVEDLWFNDIQVFHKLCKIDKVANKGLRGKEQIKFRPKIVPAAWALKQGPLDQCATDCATQVHDGQEISDVNFCFTYHFIF